MRGVGRLDRKGESEKMNALSVRGYCLKKKGATEDLPFGEDVLVLRVGSKMFALIKPEGDIARINLKCDPALALELRRKYKSVEPGYHMNKKHWNSVYLDESVPDTEIRKMIDHSYELVVKGLKKADRESIGL